MIFDSLGLDLRKFPSLAGNILRKIKTLIQKEKKKKIRLNLTELKLSFIK